MLDVLFLLLGPVRLRSAVGGRTECAPCLQHSSSNVLHQPAGAAKAPALPACCTNLGAPTSVRHASLPQEGGTLERLCSVQDQELGGPRPNPMAGYAADEEGGMMSSESILQLISSMQL